MDFIYNFSAGLRKTGTVLWKTARNLMIQCLSKVSEHCEFNKTRVYALDTRIEGRIGVLWNKGTCQRTIGGTNKQKSVEREQGNN